jgi:hypothetical protein
VVDPEPIAGADKDTTHISIIDKDGNGSYPLKLGRPLLGRGGCRR